MPLLRKLSLCALALFLTQAITAQVLLGTFELTDMNGRPVVPGAVATEVFSINRYGVLVSESWIDFHDGEGPQHNADEDCVLYPTDPFGLKYRWMNNRGTMGTTEFDFATNRWVNTVLTGPNAGRQTTMHRV